MFDGPSSQAMPIITPTYPFQNTAFNVSPNTLRIITAKMEKARMLCEEILLTEEAGGATTMNDESYHGFELFLTVAKEIFIYFFPCHFDRWAPVFKNSHILLDEYEHFVIVIASAKARNNIHWFGLIESKIRHFISNLGKIAVAE